MAELDRISLCGAPPYGPDDLFMAVVDDEGRLDISYADQFRAPMHLTPREAITLRTAIMPLLGGQNQPFSKAARGLLDKLEQALLPQDRLAMDRLERSMLAGAKGSENAPALEVLHAARTGLKSVELVYYSGSSDQLKRRTVDPYGFVLFSGSWYLVGYCHLARERRIFKVSRIKELRLTEHPYQIPRDFDISAYARSSLFKPSGKEAQVRIRFSPKIARWILESNSQAKRQKDGSALLEIKASGFSWLARWVLQYGTEAEILEPAPARAELLRILGKRKG
jgi:proteasome accessory factor C